MADEERVYSYRGRIGPLKLLAVLMILMAPGTAYMASHPESGPSDFLGLTLTPGQTVFAGWAMSAMLVIGGVSMYRGIGRAADKIQRVTLTVDTITYPELSGGLATARILYKIISNLSVIERKGHRYLEISVPAGNVQLGADNMESPQAFDEMCAELGARVRSAGLAEPGRGENSA